MRSSDVFLHNKPKNQFQFQQTAQLIFAEWHAALVEEDDWEFTYKLKTFVF